MKLADNLPAAFLKDMNPVPIKPSSNAFPANSHAHRET